MPSSPDPAMQNLASAPVIVACVHCRRHVELPYVEGQPGMVSVEPLDGWTAPPVRCPECSITKTPYGWEHVDDGTPCMEPAWCKRGHRKTPEMTEPERRDFIAACIKARSTDA